VSAFVVRHGNPTPEELGIVISVLAAAVASQVDPHAHEHRPLRAWATPAQFHRPAVVRPGRGAWVQSSRQR